MPPWSRSSSPTCGPTNSTRLSVAGLSPPAFCSASATLLPSCGSSPGIRTSRSVVAPKLCTTASWKPELTSSARTALRSAGRS
ncbi:hypothetical protein D3C76_1562800 [compost metagenome]